MTRGLVGDVGGTNGRFALVDLGGVLATHTWPTAALPALPDIARHFGLERPDFACIAVAAPVDGPSVQLTNARVVLDVRSLGIERARLANDLEAAAAGVVDAPASCRETVIAASGDAERPGLVVGLGTGLGVAIRLPDGAVLSGEGGHAPFAPNQSSMMELALALTEALGRPVEWEDLLCGRGFGRLVAWTRDERALAVSRDWPALERLARETTGAATSPAHELFMGALADFVRGLALTLRAGAVHVCGGVTGHLRHAFHLPVFRERLLIEGPVSHVLSDMPLTVVFDDQLALRGCINLSRRWFRAG